MNGDDEEAIQQWQKYNQSMQMYGLKKVLVFFPGFLIGAIMLVVLVYFLIISGFGLIAFLLIPVAIILTLWFMYTRFVPGLQRDMMKKAINEMPPELKHSAGKMLREEIRKQVRQEMGKETQTEWGKDTNDDLRARIKEMKERAKGTQ